MRLQIVVVGKVKHAGLLEAIADFERRAARYWPLDVTEIKEQTGATTAVTLAKEGERLLAAVGSSECVLCDERGEDRSSTAFATWLQERRERGRDLAFVIGSAFGVSPEVRARADSQLRLAPWTLNHDHARLILCEQIYRAGTILRKEPYHKP